MTRQELFEKLHETAIEIREGQYVDSDKLDYLVGALVEIQDDEANTVWDINISENENKKLGFQLFR